MNKLRMLTMSVLGLVLLGLAWARIHQAEQFVAFYTGERYLGGFQVLLNDAPLYLGVLLLFYGSFLECVPRVARVVLRLLGTVLTLIYAVDLHVVSEFNTRLTLGDVYRYGPHAMSYLFETRNDLLLILAALGLGALGVALLMDRYTLKPDRHHGWLLIPLGLLLLASILGARGEATYVHGWIYRNLVAHNLMIASEARPYRDAHGAPAAVTPMVCSEQESDQPDIVLLMLESFSNYQSDFFSGIEDWTPELDRIARESVAFTNFHANGFTTEDGEIALLTGLLPLHAPSRHSPGGSVAFRGFFGLEQSLPRLLGQRGYVSSFLTTAHLLFSNTGPWASSIGFDHVEGHEHASYEGWKRYHFAAAPDEALFDRLLAHLDERKGERTFLFAKSVSTHHPFTDPDTRKKSEEAAFRYTDRQLGRFYQALIARGFFDRGLLVIVGDHHAMVPLRPAELDRYGPERAGALVPLVVARGGQAGVRVAAPFQQTDVFNGLAGLVTGRPCASPWLGDILSLTPPRHIVHRRGDYRHQVSVFSGPDTATIQLDGDDTRVTSGTPTDPALRQDLVDRVNAVRARPPGRDAP